MNWGELKPGDVLISQRSLRVYVVLGTGSSSATWSHTDENWVDVELFDMHGGKHLEPCKKATDLVKPEHYVVVVATEGK